MIELEREGVCDGERWRDIPRYREREREHSRPFVKYYYNGKTCGRWAIMGVSLLEQNRQFNEDILGSNGGTDGEGHEKEKVGMVRAH